MRAGITAQIPIRFLMDCCFHEKAARYVFNYIAYIISWNVWQMDGLKGVVPRSCKDKVHREVSLFGESKEVITPCEGCRTDNIFKHNGTYCLIKDWRAKDPQTGR